MCLRLHTKNARLQVADCWRLLLIWVSLIAPPAIQQRRWSRRTTARKLVLEKLLKTIAGSRVCLKESLRGYEVKAVGSEPAEQRRNNITCNGVGKQLRGNWRQQNPISKMAGRKKQAFDFSRAEHRILVPSFRP